MTRLVRRLCVIAAVAMLAPLAVAVRSGMNELRTLTPPKISVEESLRQFKGDHPLDPDPVATLNPDNVEFVTADGLIIHGWYSDSHNGAVIAVLHGWSSNRVGMIPEAEMLAKRGFGVLLFDWRGHGASQGTHTTWGVTEKQDLQAALDWLNRTHPELLIGALGFSMGGMILVEVAATDPRIRAVALEGTWPTLRDVAFNMQPQFGPLSGLPSVWAMRWFGPDLSAVRPVDHLSSLKRPLLLIYGSEEHAYGYDLRERMAKAAGANGKLWVVGGAHHGEYAKLDPRGLETHIGDFFTSWLQSAHGAAPLANTAH